MMHRFPEKFNISFELRAIKQSVPLVELAMKTNELDRRLDLRQSRYPVAAIVGGAGYAVWVRASSRMRLARSGL